MKYAPLLTLTGCLQVSSDLTPEEESRCPTERLEETCEAWNGEFTKAVEEFKICLGQRVKVICSHDPNDISTLRIEHAL